MAVHGFINPLKKIEKPRIVIVDSSSIFSRVIQKALLDKIDCDPVVLYTVKSAQTYIEENWDKIFICIIDPILPDSPNGEILEYIFDQGVPSLIYGNHQNDMYQDAVKRLKAVDYLVKGVPGSLDHVVNVVNRMVINSGLKALVVERDRAMRTYISNLIRAYRFSVFEAESEEQTLELLSQEPDIRLALIDDTESEFCGFSLTRTIREKYPQRDLILIGTPHEHQSHRAVQFIKMGANDFLYKPFVAEEFFWRINQNMQIQETVEALHITANTDFLTGLNNRRHFFKLAEEKFSYSNKRKNDPRDVLVGILDIDHFKQVNDTYGHDAGDSVLQSIALLMQRDLAPHGVIGRLGGEEFAFVLAGAPVANLKAYLEEFRRVISENSIMAGTRSVAITVSIGVVEVPAKTLSTTLTIADQHLYIAKQTGRDRIISETSNIETPVCKE